MDVAAGGEPIGQNDVKCDVGGDGTCERRKEWLELAEESFQTFKGRPSSERSNASKLLSDSGGA